MLRLSKSKDSRWIDLHANVRVKIKPISTTVMTGAQAWALHKVKDILEARKRIFEVGGSVSDLPDLEKDSVRAAFSESQMIKGVAIHTIEEWEGVFLTDQVDGKDVLAPVTEGYICALMDEWLYANAFWEQAIAQIAGINTEGNLSALSANGISEKEQNTVTDADSKDLVVPKDNQDLTENSAPTSDTSPELSKAGNAGT